MKKIRTYFDVPEASACDIEGQLAARMARLQRRLADVRHTLAVVSGKGGVGKSVVTANLATALAADKLAVGVVDADLNGPSMARLLGARGTPLTVTADGVEPASGCAGVRVMSMDLLLAGDATPVEWAGPGSGSFVWRGTLEANTLREFLGDTEWGRLDYLILDLPPGTDRIVPLHELLPDLGGLVLISLPSDLSRFIVSKSLTMARKLDIPIIGYVENMAGYLCPHCGALGELFRPEGGNFEGVARLASLPFDPRFGSRTDAGEPDVLQRPGSPAGEAIRTLAAAVRTFFEGADYEVSVR